MLELLMQNWMAQGGSSANGNEMLPKSSKDFASVMGEQALSLPIQALLAEAVQASSESGVPVQTAALQPQLSTTDQVEVQAIGTDLPPSAEELMQQIEMNTALQGPRLPKPELAATAVAEAQDIALVRAENTPAAGQLTALDILPSELPLEDALPALDDTAQQTLQPPEMTEQQVLPFVQASADVKSPAIEVAAVPPVMHASSPEIRAKEIAVSEELTRPMILGTAKESRSGQTFPVTASRLTADAVLTGVSAEHADSAEGLAQQLAESRIDAVVGKVQPSQQALQALAVNAPTPLLNGVAELSSTLAVNSIASLDSVQAGLSPSSTNTLQTVAIQDIAAHALAIIRQRGHDQGDARLALHPAELGSLDMTIEQDGKRLDMTVLVDNEQARTAVSEQLSQLRERLAESGLKLASLDISLRDSGERQNNDEQGSADTHATEEGVNNPSQTVVSLSENALDLYA